jgi:hypothetical protein
MVDAADAFDKLAQAMHRLAVALREEAESWPR